MSLLQDVQDSVPIITSAWVASRRFSNSDFLLVTERQLITATFKGMSFRPFFFAFLVLFWCFGDDEAVGLPMSKSVISGDSGVVASGVNGLVSSRHIVSKKVVEKFGMPHVQQCHETFCRPL